MRWYLGIIVWIADAINRKVELDEDDSVDARLKRIEEKLVKTEKSNIPVALFASGTPIFLIGFAGSLKNAIEVISFEWQNFTYLFIGSLLITWAMKKYTGKNRDSFITILITFGVLIIISAFNIIRTS